MTREGERAFRQVEQYKYLEEEISITCKGDGEKFIVAIIKNWQ